MHPITCSATSCSIAASSCRTKSRAKTACRTLRQRTAALSHLSAVRTLPPLELWLRRRFGASLICWKVRSIFSFATFYLPIIKCNVLTRRRRRAELLAQDRGKPCQEKGQVLFEPIQKVGCRESQAKEICGGGGAQHRCRQARFSASGSPAQKPPHPLR